MNRQAYLFHQVHAAKLALSLAGQVVMWRAAYCHRASGIALDHTLIVANWSHSLLTVPRPAVPEPES